jgi:hypothetical protein
MSKITAVGLLTREQFDMIYEKDSSEVRWVVPVSIPQKKHKKYAILKPDWWKPPALKWREYRKLIPAADKALLTAVKDYVIKNQIHCCAFDEILDNFYLVLSDGSIFYFDYVTWESFLSAVWNTLGNCRYYTYSDFMPYDKYNDLSNDFVLPEIIKAQKKVLWKKEKNIIKKTHYNEEAHKSRIHWSLMCIVKNKMKRKLNKFNY